MIEVSNLTKSYNSLKALDNVSFTLNEGEIVGLLGVNGAGKSTLMRLLSGITEPDSGNINYQEKRYNPVNLLEIKKQIGYLSEDNPLYNDMYVKEYLTCVADIYKVPKEIVNEMVELVGLRHEYRKQIGILSKGNRQRVGIAQALIHDPHLLILDEPTSGLDPNQRESIIQLLKSISENKIILFSTHILQEATDICSRFIFLDKGQIVADKKADEIESVTTLFHKLTNENNSR